MPRATMDRRQSPVVTGVVRRGLCSGCGVCAATCPGACLEMDWDRYGARVPIQVRECPGGCSLCAAVCPFGDHGINEDDLAAELFGETSGEPTPLGHHCGAYVGYVAADTYRAEGSSGGLARWFLASLLERGHVQRVMCVVSGMDPGNLFRFADLDSPEAVRGASKSAYYPTDLADVLRNAADARYAVIGLPCVAKAVRLAARRVPGLAARVTVVAGLVCAKLWTRSFAEYITRSAGLARDQVNRLSFREKHPGRPATDFSVLLDGDAGAVSVAMPWAAYGSGQFKLRACGVCDDVFAETADITFMDAWLPRYSGDPGGTSIVITRSPEADAFIREGIARGELSLERLPAVEVMRSQRGGLRERQHLGQRLWLMEADGEAPPAKRVQPMRPSAYQRWLLVASEDVRQASHEAMRRQREVAPVGLDEYHRLMRGPLRRWRLIRVPDLATRLPAWLRRRAERVLMSRKSGER